MITEQKLRALPAKYRTQLNKHIQFISSDHMFKEEILELCQVRFNDFYVQSVTQQGPAIVVTVLTHVTENRPHRYSAHWALRQILFNIPNLVQMKKETVISLPTVETTASLAVTETPVNVEPSEIIADETGATHIVRGESKVVQDTKPTMVGIFFDETSKQPVVLIEDELRVPNKGRFNKATAKLVPYSHNEHNKIQKPTTFDIKFAHTNTPLHVLRNLFAKRNPLVKSASVNSKNTHVFFNIEGLSVALNAYMLDNGQARIVTKVDPRLASLILKATPSIKVTPLVKRKPATQKIDLSAIDVTALKVK